jgi:mannose-1-phosphate guanylyltransferase
MHAYLPEVARKIDAIVNVTGTPQQQTVLDEIWPSLPTISIDYGVLEKSNNIAVIPADLGWNDVGNWEQYGSLFPSNKQSVAAVGHHIDLGSHNIFVYNNTPRQVYTIGLEDIIVIEVGDKTVVCHKDSVQRVKELAESQLKKV